MSLELEEYANLSLLPLLKPLLGEGTLLGDTDSKRKQKGNATCFSLPSISCLPVVFSNIRSKWEAGGKGQTGLSESWSQHLCTL